MSKFLSKRYDKLIPYTPGEQPKEMEYLKLNTNESPFPPSNKAIKSASLQAEKLNLYPDPDCRDLTQKLADQLGVCCNEVLLTNGSDEILNFAFMAYCDKSCGAIFPDITYGFYKVFAELYNIDYTEIPLETDFSIDISKYFNTGKTIFIANPNAPTGVALSLKEIEQIIINNPDNMVVIDEAYVDFGNESCVGLIHKYNNLLVTQTFSKSRSMAGARLGFGVGCKEVIADLNAIKYSTNPYNINRMTMAAGLGVLEDNEYTINNCKHIISSREHTVRELKELGFSTTDSTANFIFAKHESIGGKELYMKLKEKGILVRHFDKNRISQYNRITVGTHGQMEKFIKAVKEILEEF